MGNDDTGVLVGCKWEESVAILWVAMTEFFYYRGGKGVNGPLRDRKWREKGSIKVQKVITFFSYKGEMVLGEP